MFMRGGRDRKIEMRLHVVDLFISFCKTMLRGQLDPSCVLYSTRDTPVVTHLSTSLAVVSISRCSTS